MATSEPEVPHATVVYVVYRTDALDLGWLPDTVPVVVVHHDDHLDPATCRHPSITHIHQDNVGFGAGANAGARAVATGRLVFANPDTILTDEHWRAVSGGRQDHVITIPLDDRDGVATAVTSPYPRPLSHLATAYRLGRYVRRGSPLRRLLSRIDPWTRDHQAAQDDAVGTWPLRERWVSGALLSIDAGRFHAVGGFDTDYFLYFEDADLCRRLAARFPQMEALVPPVPAGVHLVGASTTAGNRSTALHHLRSAQRWAASERGRAWRVVAAAMVPRRWWLERRA